MQSRKVVPEKLPGEAYRTLEDIVGEDWVSEDRAIVEGYSKEFMPHSGLKKHGKDAACIPSSVVLPATREEVQAIVRCANRYKVPFAPFATGFALTVPETPGTIAIDLSRMNRILNIDTKNRTATIQPYATYAQLNAEAMKRGLWNGGIPLAGSQCKVIANYLFQALWQTAVRFPQWGGPFQIVSLEWVLPNGDIVKTGSSTIAGAEDFFWHSPGPDLMGLLRGALGSLGIVTRMTVKLYPWVGGSFPETRSCWIGEPPTHDTPDTTPLPERHRIHWIEYPDFDSEIEGMHQIAESGIGSHINGTDTAYHCFYTQPTEELALKRYNEGFFPDYLVYVIISGISSERQIDYEERVLKQIVTETGGKFLTDEKILKESGSWNLDAFRSQNVARMLRLGGFAPFRLPITRLDFCSRLDEKFRELIKRYPDHPSPLDESPPFIYILDRGHHCVFEVDFYYHTHQVKELEISTKVFMEEFIDSTREDLGYYFGGVAGEPFTSMCGPVIGPDVHLLLKRIKKAFDPNDIAAPGRLVKVKET